jgi:flavin reductase
MVAVPDFRNAMALLGGAVSVITTDGQAGRCGFTASAVCSVTDSPPTLLVCMNRASLNNANFKTNGVLCVNILAAEHHEISGRFANRELSMDQRFATTRWDQLATGAPVMEEAIANFDCRVVQVHEVGSHSIFYCEVAQLRIAEGREGLMYFNRAYHRLGDDSRLTR